MSFCLLWVHGLLRVRGDAMTYFACQGFFRRSWSDGAVELSQISCLPMGADNPRYTTGDNQNGSVYQL